MTPERHARIKAVFLEACQQDAATRGAWLDDACAGDPDLRLEVESLLAYHDESAAAAAGAVPEDGPAGTHRAAGRFDTGTLLAGRFRIVALAGRGGMGEVYRADDVVLGQRVALKFLPAGVAADAAARERVYREVRLAREVTHPNVCRVHDVGEHEGDVFISMEYVDGEDLASLMRRIGRLSPAKAAEVSRQVCDGLAAVHARGVLHRDLKPGNVMIDGRGQVRLTDFGIATPAHAPADSTGTPAYMAPEQLQGRAASVQSDLYALGVLLYEIHAARHPFAGPADAPRSLVELTGDIDPAIDTVILQCLDPDPARRPASARVVAGVFAAPDPLAAAIAAGETPSPEAVAASRLRGHAVRPAAVWAAVAVCVLAVAASFALAGPLFDPARQGLDTSPAVLADRAAAVLKQTGAFHAPASDAAGLAVADPAIDAAKPVLFWYRRSTAPLVPGELRNVFWGFSSVTLDDPPNRPGASRVVLDPAGLLVLLETVPEATWPRPGPDAPAVDWAPVFGLAGLASAAFAPAEPEGLPPFHVDARRAWQGPDPAVPGGYLHVEAGEYGGRPVYFRVREWARALDEPPAERFGLFLKLTDLQLLLLLVAAIPIARRNFAHGRVDRRAALRLAAFVLAARLVTWVMRATHVADWDAEVDRLFAATGSALLEAARVWLFYVALEPQVRRIWPQVLISFNRLMAGRLRDPILGRDVAVGAAIGAAYMLLLLLDEALPRWLSLLDQPWRFDPDVLVATLGTRGQAATAVEVLLDAIYDTVFTVMFLVLLRAVLRRTWLAAAVFVAATAWLTALEGVHPATSWLVMGGLVGALTGVALLRFGLVTALTATFVNYLLQSYPLTLDLGAWYAEASVFAVVVVGTVTAYGAWAALSE